MLLQTIAPPERIRFGPGGGEYRIVTTAAETGGRIFAFEAIEPPGGGPPLHTHANEDEYFYVTEGEMSFYIDGKVIRARAGESAFVPRGLPHCFRNRSHDIAKMIVLFTPGQIEGFFDYALPIDGRPRSDDELVRRLVDYGRRFGLEMIGPSPL